MANDLILAPVGSKELATQFERLTKSIEDRKVHRLDEMNDGSRLTAGERDYLMAMVDAYVKAPRATAEDLAVLFAKVAELCQVKVPSSDVLQGYFESLVRFVPRHLCDAWLQVLVNKWVYPSFPKIADFRLAAEKAMEPFIREHGRAQAMLFKDWYKGRKGVRTPEETAAREAQLKRERAERAIPDFADLARR